MKIEIASVINRAKIRLGLQDTTRWDAVLEQHINEAAFNLDAVSSFSVSCEILDIECHEATLPLGYETVISFTLLDQNGCAGCCDVSTDPSEGENRNMACNCADIWFFDKNVLTEFNGNGLTACYGGNFFAVQNGRLKFPTSITATRVKVWYMGYNMDSDGIMILDERQQRGFSAYAAWQFASSGTHYNKYNPNQIRGWEREWVNQRGRLVGLAAQDDFINNKGKFASIASALLINPMQTLNKNL